MHDCPICFDIYNNKFIYKYECCQQIICLNCIKILIYNYKPCPFCRTEYDSNYLYDKINEHIYNYTTKAKTKNINKVCNKNFIKINIENIKKIRAKLAKNNINTNY
jgi:hypothetical protein